MSTLESYRRRATELHEQGSEQVKAQQAEALFTSEVALAMQEAASLISETPQYLVIAELLHPDTVSCVREFIEKKRPTFGGEEIESLVVEELQGYASIFPWQKRLRSERNVLHRNPVYTVTQVPQYSRLQQSSEKVQFSSSTGILPSTFVTFYDPHTFAERYLDQTNNLTEEGRQRVIFDYFRYCASIVEMQSLIDHERVKDQDSCDTLITGYQQKISDILADLGITTYSNVTTHPTVEARAFGHTAKIVAKPHINGAPRVQLWVHADTLNKPVDSVDEALLFLAELDLQEYPLVK